MTDRELLELIAAHVNRLTKDVDEMKDTMAARQELADVKAIVIKSENDHGQGLGALLDGYKQNSEILEDHNLRLERIEEKVTTHRSLSLC